MTPQMIPYWILGIEQLPLWANLNKMTIKKRLKSVINDTLKIKIVPWVAKDITTRTKREAIIKVETIDIIIKEDIKEIMEGKEIMVQEKALEIKKIQIMVVNMINLNKGVMMDLTQVVKGKIRAQEDIRVIIRAMEEVKDTRMIGTDKDKEVAMAAIKDMEDPEDMAQDKVVTNLSPKV